MAALPSVGYRKVVKAFATFGWQVVRQRKSHIIMMLIFDEIAKQVHAKTLFDGSRPGLEKDSWCMMYDREINGRRFLAGLGWVFASLFAWAGHLQSFRHRAV